MKSGCHHIAILLLVGAGLCQAQQFSDFSGTWVLKFNGQAILKLSLAVHNGSITGQLTKPKQLSIDDGGDVTSIGAEQATLPVEKPAFTGKQLAMTIDGDAFTMTLENHERALLATGGMHPLHLERAADSEKIVLATRLAERDYPAEIRALRAELQAMVRQDQEARLAFDQSRSEAVDEKNRTELLRIFDRYGWIAKSLAGGDASHDFWLLIQHQTPEIQRRMLPALEKAAKNGDASLSDYAYLYDRVQMGLGRPQHWAQHQHRSDSDGPTPSRR